MAEKSEKNKNKKTIGLKRTLKQSKNLIVETIDDDDELTSTTTGEKRPKLNTAKAPLTSYQELEDIFDSSDEEDDNKDLSAEEEIGMEFQTEMVSLAQDGISKDKFQEVADKINRILSQNNFPRGSGTVKFITPRSDDKETLFFSVTISDPSTPELKQYFNSDVDVLNWALKNSDGWCLIRSVQELFTIRDPKDNKNILKLEGQSRDGTPERAYDDILNTQFEMKLEVGKIKKRLHIQGVLKIQYLVGRSWQMNLESIYALLKKSMGNQPYVHVVKILDGKRKIKNYIAKVDQSTAADSDYKNAHGKGESESSEKNVNSGGYKKYYNKNK